MKKKRKNSDREKSLIPEKSRKFVVVVLAFILSFLALEKYFVFVLLTIGSAIFNFYHDRFNKTIFDFKLTLVMGILLSHKYGIVYGLIFLFTSNVIPTILGGGKINAPYFIFNLEFLIIFLISSLLTEINVILLGIALVILDSILGVIINTNLGINMFVAISSGTASLLIRIVYFLTLGRLIEKILFFV
jgi:hypothetical protein